MVILAVTLSFSRDFNVSKTKSSIDAALVDNFCPSNGLLWLDSVINDVNYSYTYHADNNGHYSHIDHF